MVRIAFALTKTALLVLGSRQEDLGVGSRVVIALQPPGQGKQHREAKVPDFKETTSCLVPASPEQYVVLGL